MIDEEEYKKRLERARQLRNSIGIVSLSDNSTEINSSSNDTKDYKSRLERAKNLRNSLGIYTSEELKDTTINVIKTDNESNKTTTNNPTAITIEAKNEANKPTISSKEENKTNVNIGNKTEKNKITVNPSNKPLRDVNSTSNLPQKIRIATNKETQNQQIITSHDIKVREEAEERNKQIEKGGIEKFNATTKTILKNIEGGVLNTVAGLANVVTTIAGFGVRGLETWANVFNQTETSGTLNNWYDNIVETGRDISDTGSFEIDVTNRIENDAIRTTGIVTNTVSEVATNAVIGMILPGGGIPGTIAQGLSVGGRSSQEVLDENPDSIGQATITGIAKGYTAYLTEKLFDANILTKGQGSSISNKIDDLIFDTIKSKYGKEFANKTVGIIGENIEEILEDNIGNIIDKLVNDKDFPTIQEWWNNTKETAKVTTLSTIIMSLLGLGGGNFESKVPDIMTRKVQQIIDEGGYAIQYDTNNILNTTDMKTLYTAQFNQDGDIESIDATQGKEILNPNRKVNVTPAIIKNTDTDTYNIIDANTGVMLDSTPYRTLIQAQAEFGSKMINLDEASIKGINEKITQSNIAINNKIREVITESKTQLANMSQNTQNDRTAILNNETINVSSNNTKLNVEQNNTAYDTYNSNNVQNNSKNVLNDISKLVTQISDNSIYKNEEAKNIFTRVAQDIPNVNIIEQSGNTYINSLDKNGEVVYQQKIKNRLYTGSQIKNIVNNAMNNADLSNIDTPDSIENYRRGFLNNKTTNYTNRENETVNSEKENIKSKERKFTKVIDQYKNKAKEINLIKDNIVIINSNVLEGISKNKHSSFMNEYLKYEVQGHNYYINKEKIIATSKTIGKLKNGHTNFEKKIDYELQKEIKANIISNLDNVISVSQLYQKDRIDTKNHTFADTFDRRKSIIQYKGQKYEVMFEIGKKDGINTLYGIESVKKTNKKRLSLPNLTSNNKGLNDTKDSVGSHKSNQSIAQRGNFVNKSSNVAVVQNNKNDTSNKVNQSEKIEDFGEKIGDARKDLSQKRNLNKEIKEVVHNYAVKTTESGFAVTFKNRILKDGFTTQTEAEKYILDFKENIKSNLAYVEEGNNRNGENVYTIKIRNPQTLKSTYTNKVFTNKTEAESYAMALSIYLKEYGKNLFRPEIQKVERINNKNKNAINATGNDILNNFGFKGGEFGNWVNQKERQQFLNYAQDAFTDLSLALNIEPISLGQNNGMNIAFGARGKGLSGAVAHFEPQKRVINMTRLKGSGSLAHEYGHSIDNYLSRESGYSDEGMATTNSRNSNLSDNMKKAIKDVKDAIEYNTTTNQEEVNKKNEIYEKNRKESLSYHLKYLDKIFSGEATKIKRVKGKYENVPIEVTNQQKDEYKKIKDILINGKLDGNIDYKVNAQTLKTDKIYPKPIDKIQKMYKEVVGRKIDDDTLYWLFRYGKPSKQITEVKSESAFRKSALELDRLTGRKTAYFSKIEEMWARAFESYVSDKLKAKGITNTYLVHSVNNSDYALFNPFPAGEERQNINKAFDNLIETMKNEGLFETSQIKSDTIKQTNNDVSYIRSMKKGTSKKQYNNVTELLNEGLVDLQEKNRDSTLAMTNKQVGANSSRNSNISNSISQKNNSVKNNTKTNTINNMQNNENNTVLAKKTADQIIPGQTNAERTDAYIEQEIKKIEQDGSWDNSIPVTKRSDIRKTIEDYLGLGIQKGHFRQQAYAIYNSKNDSIRTKELKDMDSILHETGHALDLGNRINIDKESISDELLTAVSKLNGYENETRDIRLEEGFAEVIREYSIIPEQAKKDYPQTVAVLEGIRQQDKSFDNFIIRLQKQTYNYIHQSPRNRELSNQSIGEQTDKSLITKDSIKENIIKWVWDKDYLLKSAVNELSKTNEKEVKLSQNAYILTRLVGGVNNKAISMISDGYIDLNGSRIMPGLNQLGELLNNDPQRFDDLRAYLVAQRDLEYKAKSLKTGLRTMDSKAVVEQFKNDYQIQQASQIVYNTLDGVLQYAVDNGLISEENAEVLRKSNAFYVPFQRVLDLDRGNQVGRSGSVAEIIRKRTGSELDIKDVLENIVVNSANIIQQVENNNVLRALYNQGEEVGIKNNLFQKIPTPMQKVGTATLSTWKTELKKQGIDTDNIDLEKTIDIFAPNNKIDTTNLITSFIDTNGKRVYLQFAKGTQDLFYSIMRLDRNTNSMFLKIMRKMNMPLRYGATMANVGFAIPNMISDTAQATIYSEAGFIPVVDNALGVLDILTATNKTVRNFIKQYYPAYVERINNLYSLYEQSGSSNSTRLSQYRKTTQEIMKDIYGTKNSETLGIKESFKPLKKLLDIMTYIPELSENSTRFRVFEKNYEAYKNKGGSELDARIKGAIESRDATQDFGRTGTLTHEINQLIPFSAARVGSAYTFMEKIKANPKTTSARIAMLTVIAMVIKGVGYDDEEIEELNQRKKNDNFVFKIGDSIITIKKPQGIMRTIINFAEYIQDLATGHIEEGKEGERLAEWIENAIMDNMPADEVGGLIPNAFAPLIENAVNKDFYYNTDIVKSYDLDLPNYMQYYDYTSQLAIWLGKIFNYSPAKIDNLISGYFGGLGTQVTDTIDWISGKFGLSAEKPAMGAEDNAVGKRFVVNINENSASIDEVYTRETELTKKKNGGIITTKEKEELERLTEAISVMSKINKQIKAIKADLTISGKEKAELIRPLQEQKTDTARQALGKELIYSENADKITSTKFYPSRSTLSQSGYTLELTEDMKKEYEEISYSRYRQYEKQGLYSKEKLEQLESQCKDYAKQFLMRKYKSKLTRTK